MNLTRALILGLCSEGPYRYARESIENPTVKWISWGYNEEYVHPDVLNDIKAKTIAQGTKISFCFWNLTKEKLAKLLRGGVIDHISHRGGYLSLTVFLGDALSGTVDLYEKDHFLCRYADPNAFEMTA